MGANSCLSCSTSHPAACCCAWEHSGEHPRSSSWFPPYANLAPHLSGSSYGSGPAPRSARMPSSRSWAQELPDPAIPGSPSPCTPRPQHVFKAWGLWPCSHEKAARTRARSWATLPVLPGTWPLQWTRKGMGGGQSLLQPDSAHTEPPNSAHVELSSLQLVTHNCK